jgi:hypothetical protein
MANLILNGSTSGSVTLSSPAVSGTTTLTLPTTSGTVITTATGQTLTSPVIAGTPTGVGVLTAGTAVASTSGTSIDFTGIPSWVKRITVMFNGVSTNSTSIPLIQLGDSGGIETTGYLSSASYIAGSNGITVNGTTGFPITGATLAADLRHGSYIITLLDPSSNLWTIFGGSGTSNLAQTGWVGGSKSLSATLDRIRITTTNGTDTFDAGSINILYE